MSEVTIIGMDLHGALQDGSVVICKKLSRGQLLAFVSAQPRWVIAMDACATAHAPFVRGVVAV